MKTKMPLHLLGAGASFMFGNMVVQFTAVQHTLCQEQ